MLQETEGQLREHHFGKFRQERALAKVERIVAQELRRLGWQETDLASRPKSHPAKLQIAARLSRETTLSIKQIAGRLCLGTSRSANVRLHDALSQSAPAISAHLSI